MRHRSGEIGRTPPPPRLPRSPVSGAPTGHSPQTLQLPELFDLIICGAKSRVRPIAAGRSSIWPRVVAVVAPSRRQMVALMSTIKSTTSWVNTADGGRGAASTLLAVAFGISQVSPFRRTLSRCASQMKCATSCHARSGESLPPKENKLQSWGCPDADAIARAPVSNDQPSGRAITPAPDQWPRRASDCYLVSRAFSVKLAPMVLLLASVACDCPMACRERGSPPHRLI